MDDRTIDRMTRRPKRYWYEDGIAEIVAAVVFALVGLLFLAEAVLPLPSSFSAIALIVVVFFGVRAGRSLLASAKARLTYRRTGEVTYRRSARHGKLVALSIVLATAIAAAIARLTVGTVPLSWVPLGDGVVIGAFLAYNGYALGISRFYGLAAASALIGFAAASAGLDDITGSAIYFGGMAIALLGSGGATLWRYLRQPAQPIE